MQLIKSIFVSLVIPITLFSFFTTIAKLYELFSIDLIIKCSASSFVYGYGAPANHLLTFKLFSLTLHIDKKH